MKYQASEKRFISKAEDIWSRALFLHVINQHTRECLSAWWNTVVQQS